MDLLALRYFQAVARLEHISRAADELRVAQPSLSRTLGRLEGELGVPLFDRHGRRIKLNRFGAAFLERVDRALSELDDGVRELADAAGLEHGSVAVASETLLPLTGPLRAFVAEQPKVNIRLFQSSAEQMRRQLQLGEVDLCIASQPLELPDLRSVVLLDEKVHLAVPADHRLAGQRSTTVAELAEEPLVTTRRGYWPRELAERLFAQEGLRPNIVCEADEPASTFELVAAGLGVGLFPDAGRLAEFRTTASWVDVDTPGCTRTLSAVWRGDAYQSAAAHAFRAHTVKYFKSYALR